MKNPTHSDVIVRLLEVSDLDAASDLGEEGQPEDGQGNGDFLVAGEGTAHD